MAIITVNAETGAVEFTRSSKLLELFDGERKDIVRMTDIQHDSEHDLFYIKFLTGPWAGEILAVHHLMELAARADEQGYDIQTPDAGSAKVFFIDRVEGAVNVPGFRTYEDAVKFEVLIVDDMRRLFEESMHVA